RLSSSHIAQSQVVELKVQRTQKHERLIISVGSAERPKLDRCPTSSQFSVFHCAMFAWKCLQSDPAMSHLSTKTCLRSLRTKRCGCSL
ncbi:hypothetical protein BgiMline_011211, partial [Biomphalaria glabrata]